MSKEDKLKGYLKELISTFRQDSRRHKKLHRSLRVTAFLLTGLATVFSSMALTFAQFQNWLNILIVIVTAAASFITAYEGLRKPAELWIHERLLLHQLHDLLRKVDYEAGEIEENIDEDFNELQKILAGSQQKWAQLVSRPPGGDKDGGNS